MRHYKIWRFLEGLEGPKRPRSTCFFYIVFRGSKLIHRYLVRCGRLLECLNVIVMRVLESSWRVLEGLEGPEDMGGSRRILEGPLGSWKVWEGLGGSGGYGRVQEGLGGSGEYGRV